MPESVAKLLPFIGEIQTSLASQIAFIPWQIEPPTGLAALRRIVDSTSSVSRW
jgi:hypothetical protein